LLPNNDILDILIFLGSQLPSHCIEISGLQVLWRHQNIMFWFGLAPSLLFLSTSLMVISDLFFCAFSSVITEKMIIA
jgi:hypothetical protein